MIDNSNGKLYICPTPIGNLEDITLRVLRILKEVDLIAAEDTRRTIKLLNHYDIKKPLTSYHEHNKTGKGKFLIEKLKNGENIALVSDAGMPGISDPGEDLIKEAIDNNIDIVVLPGPSASITALVLSGLPTSKFVFLGFLSNKKKDRIRELEDLKYEEKTLILYESPYRLMDLLKDILKTLGNRKISISKELTKIYEDTYRGYVEGAIERYKGGNIKGEYVLTIQGQEEEEKPMEEISIKDEIKDLLEEGYTNKEAILKISRERNIPKNLVYKESLNK